MAVEDPAPQEAEASNLAAQTPLPVSDQRPKNSNVHKAKSPD